MCNGCSEVGSTVNHSCCLLFSMQSHQRTVALSSHTHTKQTKIKKKKNDRALQKDWVELKLQQPITCMNNAWAAILQLRGEETTHKNVANSFQTNIAKPTSNTHDRIGIQRSRLTVVNVQEAMSVIAQHPSESTPPPQSQAQACDAVTSKKLVNFDVSIETDGVRYYGPLQIAVSRLKRRGFYSYATYLSIKIHFWR